MPEKLIRGMTRREYDKWYQTTPQRQKNLKEYRESRHGKLMQCNASKRYHNKMRPIVTELKSNGCSICGYKECESALIFHHTKPEDKKFELTINGIQRYSIEKIGDEINKCILLCCNCHCKLHEKERKVK
jgi:hypothetical protein